MPPDSNNIINLRRNSIDGTSADRVRINRDAWETDDLRYSPQNIYVRATDENGQSAKVEAGIPPAMKAEIKALVESGAIPEYRTISDLVRDAIHHRMHWVADQVDSGELQRRITATHRLSEIERLHMEATTFAETVRSVQVNFNAARVANDTTMIQMLAEQVRAYVDQGDYREPYASQLLELCAIYEEFPPD